VRNDYKIIPGFVIDVDQRLSYPAIAPYIAQRMKVYRHPTIACYCLVDLLIAILTLAATNTVFES
jgi:hypothetical protein